MTDVDGKEQKETVLVSDDDLSKANGPLSFIEREIHQQIEKMNISTNKRESVIGEMDFDFEKDQISNYLTSTKPHNQGQVSYLSEEASMDNDEELFADHDFLDGLIDMLQRMQIDQKKAMEEYQFQQQKQRRKSQVSKPVPKITIGRFGMM